MKTNIFFLPFRIKQKRKSLTKFRSLFFPRPKFSFLWEEKLQAQDDKTASSNTKSLTYKICKFGIIQYTANDTIPSMKLQNKYQYPKKPKIVNC